MFYSHVRVTSLAKAISCCGRTVLKGKGQSDFAGEGERPFLVGGASTLHRLPNRGRQRLSATVGGAETPVYNNNSV